MSVSKKLKIIADNVSRVFDAGHKVGEVVGQESGYQAGYIKGESDGYSSGYEHGLNLGTEQGYTVGYDQGIVSGKIEGQQAEYDRFWDDFQQNGARKSYFCAFAGSCWTPKTFKPKYPIKIVETSSSQRYAGRMFMYFARGQKDTANARPCSITPDVVDFSECINPVDVFSNAWFDEVTVDFGNAVSLNNTFALGDSGGGISKINIRVTEKATSFSGAFNYASTLKELIFTEDSVIAASIDVRRSPLSKASFLSIANALSPSVTATLSVQKAAVDAAFPDRTEWDALFADKSNWTITEV